MEYWTTASLLLYSSKSGDEEKVFSDNVRKELFKEKNANEERPSDKVKVWPSQKQENGCSCLLRFNSERNRFEAK